MCKLGNTRDQGLRMRTTEHFDNVMFITNSFFFLFHTKNI